MKLIADRAGFQLWSYPKCSWAIYSHEKETFIRNGPDIAVVLEFNRLTTG